jgi:hypothetical protein
MESLGYRNVHLEYVPFLAYLDKPDPSA